MKEFNTTITDQDLSELLKGLLINTEADNAFMEELIGIECKKAFANMPFIAPSLLKEKELLKTLNKQFGHFSNTGWLMTGIGTATIVTAAVLLNNNAGKHNTNTSSIAPLKNKVALTIDSTNRTTDETPFRSVEKKTVEPLLKTDGFKYFITPPSSASVDLNLYEDFTKNNAPFSNIPGTDDTLPKHTYYSAGVLRNLSKEKNTLQLDTFFSGITRLEITGPFVKLNVVATEGKNVSLKGELNYEMKGLYVKRSDYKAHYERNGTTLKVWLKNEGKHNTLIMGTMNCDGFLNFEVPAATELIMKNNSGDINVKGMRGNICNIETEFGHIKADDIHNNIHLKSLSGNITGTGISGDVEVRANFGFITLKDIDGDVKTHSLSGNIDMQNITGNMEIESRFGFVNVNTLEGNLKLNATSGNVTLKNIKGEMLSINSTFGNLHITNAVTEIKLNSKSGEITLDNISGNINATSHFGGQHFANIKGNIRTKSSSGSVTIKNSIGETDIHSNYGNINMNDCKGKISIDVKSGEVYGKNIECSDSLNIKTGFGNIHISLKNKLDDLSFDLNSTSGRLKISNEDAVISKENGNLVLAKGRIIVKTFSTSGDQLFD